LKWTFMIIHEGPFFFLYFSVASYL
jgi:hypothetical protein